MPFKLTSSNLPYTSIVHHSIAPKVDRPALFTKPQRPAIETKDEQIIDEMNGNNRHTDYMFSVISYSITRAV